MAGYNIPDTFNQKDSLRSRGGGTGGPTPGAGGASSSGGATFTGGSGTSTGPRRGKGDASARLRARLGAGGPDQGIMRAMPVGRPPKVTTPVPKASMGRSMSSKAPTMPGPAKEVQAFQQGPRGPRRGS